MVNGKDIYPLTNDKPVVITVQENHPKIVVTDGFHFTKPLELIYHHLNTYHFKVICAIGDFQLLAGFFLLALLYLLGFYSGLFWVKLASFAPIFYILFIYYINRKEFLQITPV